MQKKEDIQKEIDRLKAVSPVDAGEAFVPILKAVKDFFDSDKELEQKIGECAFQLAFNYEYRNTVYNNQENMPTFSEKYPPGYKDVRDLFTGGGVWEEIASVPEEVFVAAFIYTTPGGDMSNSDTSEVTTPVNPYLDDWTKRIEAARAAIVPSLNVINDFCEATATANGLAIYFEEHGGIASAPKRKEIAERVYIKGGYLEIIQTYALSVYIPSYINKI